MRRKVLLADDSLSIQKMLGLYLEKCEIDVVALSNGETAVSKLPTVQPDLILADVFMPGRTGYEVCEYVKQHPDFKHIPVLLLTGKFEPYDEKEAKRVKADGHIVKPVAEQEFITLVRKMLEQVAPRPAAPQPAAPTPSIAQTQVLGSLTPPVAKESSSLGGQLPQFHFGGRDLPADIPPPTIKVTPSMLDDGRLPDLEPLLPLDTPPAPPSQDTGDFILDLPPPEQAPPILAYPEPPKTLSTPLPRPTFSPMPVPDFGTTTVKLAPGELPELLADVLPPAPAAPTVVEAESPLELDDAPPPAAATVTVDTAPIPPSAGSDVTDRAIEDAGFPTTAAPPAAEGFGLAPETPAIETTPQPPAFAEVTPAFVVPPPEQVALLGAPEQLGTAPMTIEAAPAAGPTDALSTEPVPPPDFLVGLVSAPAAEPLLAVAEETVPPVAPASVMPPVSSVTTSVAPVPTFEVVTEESSAPETDLLPDELRAIHAQQHAEARVEPRAEPVAEPVFEATSEGSVTSAGAPPSFTFEVPVAEAVEGGPVPTFEPMFATPLAPAPEPTITPAEGTPSAFAVETPPETVATEVSPISIPSTAAEPATPVIGPAIPEATTFSSTFAPAPLETVSLVPESPAGEQPTPVEVAVAPPAVENDEVAVAPVGSVTLVDESVHCVESPATLVDESVKVDEVAAAVAPVLPSPLPETPLPPVETVTDTVGKVPVETSAGSLVVGGSTASGLVAVDWSSLTLPPPVMDDIVRRVVTAISDRVVREIAWEVVPDLAELLIKKHLAEGLGRRTDG